MAEVRYNDAKMMLARASNSTAVWLACSCIPVNFHAYVKQHLQPSLFARRVEVSLSRVVFCVSSLKPTHMTVQLVCGRFSLVNRHLFVAKNLFTYSSVCFHLFFTAPQNTWQTVSPISDSLAMPPKVRPFLERFLPSDVFSCDGRTIVTITLAVYHYAKTLPFARLHALVFVRCTTNKYMCFLVCSIRRSLFFSSFGLSLLFPFSRRAVPFIGFVTFNSIASIQQQLIHT